jgi:hypothetical protein
LLFKHEKKILDANTIVDHDMGQEIRHLQYSRVGIHKTSYANL